MSGFADLPNIAGGMPPAFRNHLVPIACGTPAPIAASSLERPSAIPFQKRCRSCRPATGGRPGDDKGDRPDRSERRFFPSIATLSLEVLRRPLESTQFTSPRFTGVLLAKGVRVSMDGRGRWMDNVFIERLWRSLKYECVYLHAFETGSELRAGLTKWIDYYNADRPHSALGGQTPDEAYGVGEMMSLAA